MTMVRSIFIPEEFVGKSKIITLVPGYGWGIVIRQSDLGSEIKDGRVKHTVLEARAVAVLPEEKSE